jgi:hypothetical protein
MIKAAYVCLSFTGLLFARFDFFTNLFCPPLKRVSPTLLWLSQLQVSTLTAAVSIAFFHFCA